MTPLGQEDHDTQMKDMALFDEAMPSVGIFWYDAENHSLFGVCKQEVTPKMFEDATEKGELTTLIENEFHLPYFEFVYDEHWDLGHGWSGDM